MNDVFYADADDSGGGESLGWRAQLPGEEKTDPYYAQFDSFAAVARRAKEADGKLKSYDGKVFVPGEDATDEDRKKFETAIGVPEDYDVAGKKLGQMEIKDEWATSLKAGLKKGKFTKGQVDSVLEILNETVDSVTKVGRATFASEAKKAEQEFRKEWGEEYDTKKAGIRKLLLKYGGADYLKAMDETGLGNHPQQIRFFANLLSVLGDHGIADGKNEPGAGKKAPVGLRYPSMEGMK